MARAFRAAAAAIAATLCLGFLAPATAAVPQIKQPTWVELTPQQQQVLAPLAGEWDRMESYRRKKWLGIAKHYPSMRPDEQQRIQHRMQQWTNLSPEERMAAREKFKNLSKAPPEQRATVKQKWQEYKDLPDDEKQRLKASARRKPAPKSATGKHSPTPVAAPKLLATPPQANAYPAASAASATASSPATPAR